MAVETSALLPTDWSGRVALQFAGKSTGYTLHATTPRLAADLWRGYLDGAVDAYRRYGVEHALDYDAVVDGCSTSLFFGVTDAAGAMVAGVRAQGPYLGSEQAHALVEWEGSPWCSRVEAMIAERLPAGVVELKGWWVGRTVPDRSQLVEEMLDCALLAPMLLGARYGLGTVASFTVRRHRSRGAEIADDIPPIPYPDKRYRTVLAWWDTQQCDGRVAPHRAEWIREKRSQLNVEAVFRNGV